MPDLTINSITVPAAVVTTGTFSLDVSVTAADDPFEDGAGYRLFVFVSSLLTGGLLIPPTTIKGNLQDAQWSTQTNIFHIPVTAGAAPDIYNVTAVLLEGPRGVDPDGAPSFSSAGPIAVV